MSLNIDTTKSFNNNYNNIISLIPVDKLVIGNSLDGEITVDKFIGLYNKNDFLSIIEETYKYYKFGEHDFELAEKILNVKNKLKKEYEYNIYTVIKILYYYYKFMNDTEIDLRIPDELWNLGHTRLYIWFGTLSE